MTDELKAQIGPFQVERLIGMGASAKVWLANGPTGPVAIKTLRDPSHQDAFQREIDLLKRFRHPGLVGLIQADPNGTWLAMEHIEGPRITEWCHSKDLPQVLKVFSALLEAASIMHQSGIIHGDIKTSNIRMDKQGRPRIFDLGTARTTDSHRTGFFGTPGYVAPEVLRGEQATAASDLYGLGSVFYECLTRTMPFPTEDPAALAYLPLVNVPIPPSSFTPRLPKALDDFILDMLCRAPKFRPASAEKALHRLQGMATQRKSPVVFGMHDARRKLGSAVMAVADGETRLIVLYGPPGSGRKTLIQETLRHARRQRLAPTKSSQLASVRSGRQKPTRPPVLALSGGHPDLCALTKDLFEANIPALILVHASRPIPALQQWAEHITPPPLSIDDLTRWTASMDETALNIEHLLMQSNGHPACLAAVLYSRSANHPNPEPTKMETRVLAVLKRNGEMALPELATHLSTNEHDLLDILQPFLISGVLSIDRQRVALSEGTSR